MTERKKKYGGLRSGQTIAICLAGLATLWISSGAVTQTPDKGAEESRAARGDQKILVRVRESVSQVRQSYVTVFGRTEAVKKVNIAAETEGQVIARNIMKGAWIKKGQAILQIAMNDRGAHLSDAEAKFEYQRLAYASATKLSKKQFQSRIRVAEVLSNFESAKSELAEIRLDIHRTTVRAPINGYIETFPVGVGDYLQTGEIVATVVNLNPIRVVAHVSEREVTKLRVGDKARILLAEGVKREGEIKYVARIGEQETRTFRVEVWFSNSKKVIPEGLTAELKLKTARKHAHKVSPAVLTLNDEGIIGVKAVNKDKSVIFYPVQIMEDTNEGVWLIGLPPRLTIITVGQEFVQVGQTVRTSRDEVELKGNSTDFNSVKSAS